MASESRKRQRGGDGAKEKYFCGSGLSTEEPPHTWTIPLT